MMMTILIWLMMCDNDNEEMKIMIMKMKKWLM